MKKNNTLLKLLTYVLTVVVLSLSSVSSYASDKEYSVDTASFVAEINEDGSVDITETWTVRYEKGSFTRFYKDLYTKKLPKEEKYDLDLSSFEVSIDGHSCTPTDDTNGRPDYHYNVSKSDVGYTVSCYLSSERITRTYEISYRINNAVKFVDNDYYLFTYRYIGANFSASQGFVNVTVVSPEGSVNEVRYASNEADSFSDKNVSHINATNCSGMFKVKVRIDGASIANTVALSDSDLSNNDNESSFSIWGFIIEAFLGLGVICILTSWIKSTVNKAKVKSELSKNPMYVKEIVSKWTSKLAPFEFSFGAEAANDRVLFPLLFSYMKDRGMITIGEEHEIKVYPETAAYEVERKMVEFIEKHAALEGMKMYDNVLIDNITGSFDDYAYFADTLHHTLISSVEKKLGKEEKKAYLEDWNRCSIAVKLLKKKYEAMIEITGSSYSEETIFYAMATSKLTFDVQAEGEYVTQMDDDYFLYGLYCSCDDAYDSFIAEKNSSSGSGSGCSSCSSCSSCGGGGAD